MRASGMPCLFLCASMVALVTAFGFPPNLAWVRAELVVTHWGIIFTIAAAACNGSSLWAVAGTIHAAVACRGGRSCLVTTTFRPPQSCSDAGGLLQGKACTGHRAHACAHLGASEPRCPQPCPPMPRGLRPPAVPRRQTCHWGINQVLSGEQQAGCLVAGSRLCKQGPTNARGSSKHAAAARTCCLACGRSQLPTCRKAGSRAAQ